MREGRIAQIWAATAAAVLGVLVASAAGGYLPSWWLLALLVVIPIAATVAVSRRRSGIRVGGFDPERDERGTAQPRRAVARRAVAPVRRRRSPDVPSDPSQSVAQRPLDPDESEVVARVDAVFDRHRLHWLRTCDFDSPWLHQNVEPLFALRPLLPTRLNGFTTTNGLAQATDPLADAVGRLALFYYANTFPDPLLVGDDWRFCVSSGDVASDAATGRRGTAPDAEMRALAREVVEAYEAFRSAVAPRLAASSRMSAKGRRAG